MFADCIKASVRALPDRPDPRGGLASPSHFSATKCVSEPAVLKAAWASLGASSPCRPCRRAGDTDGSLCL